MSCSPKLIATEWWSTFLVTQEKEIVVEERAKVKIRNPVFQGEDLVIHNYSTRKYVFPRTTILFLQAGQSTPGSSPSSWNW